jgi:hypothetical protein
MHDDLLGLNGLDQATRHELYDFVVHEVELIEANQGTACRAIRISLQRQKEPLLGFATRLDNDMEKISRQHKQPLEFVQRATTLQGKSTLSSRYGQE